MDRTFYLVSKELVDTNQSQTLGIFSSLKKAQEIINHDIDIETNSNEYLTDNDMKRSGDYVAYEIKIMRLDQISETYLREMNQNIMEINQILKERIKTLEKENNQMRMKLKSNTPKKTTKKKAHLSDSDDSSS